MGVAIKRWVWLECIYRCVKRRYHYIYIYIDFLIYIIIPSPLVLALFLQQHP